MFSCCSLKSSWALKTPLEQGEVGRGCTGGVRQPDGENGLTWAKK